MLQFLLNTLENVVAQIFNRVTIGFVVLFYLLTIVGPEIQEVSDKEFDELKIMCQRDKEIHLLMTKYYSSDNKISKSEAIEIKTLWTKNRQREQSLNQNSAE